MNTNLERPITNKESVSVFASLSESWGTRERTLLKDAEIAQDNKLNPVIFCKKGSFLAKNANAVGFPVIYHLGKVQGHIFKWYKFRNFSNYLNSKNINFIHCYDLRILWVLCFLLRNMPMTPLFLTITSELKKSYLEIWHKTLISRVDQVFVFSDSISEEVRLRLGIVPRKITKLGYGVDVQPVTKTIITKVKKELGITSGVFSVGSILSPHFKDLEPILPLIYAVIGFNQKYLDGTHVKLILISEEKWNKNPLYQDLIRFIKDAGCEEDVLFYSGTTLEVFQRSVDLWLGIFEGYHISDFAIQALLNEIPILVPRNSEVMELIDTYSGIGEAYRREDSFGLREKMEKVLLNKKTYQKEVIKNSKIISATHRKSLYVDDLLGRYNKIMAARVRAASKKSLLPSNK